MSKSARAKVQRVDGALAVVLPREVREKLDLREGDELVFIGVSDTFMLLRADSKLLRTMKHAAECMNRYPNTLRDLGK